MICSVHGTRHTTSGKSGRESNSVNVNPVLNNESIEKYPVSFERWKHHNDLSNHDDDHKTSVVMIPTMSEHNPVIVVLQTVISLC